MPEDLNAEVKKLKEYIHLLDDHFIQVTAKIVVQWRSGDLKIRINSSNRGQHFRVILYGLLDPQCETPYRINPFI